MKDNSPDYTCEINRINSKSAIDANLHRNRKTKDVCKNKLELPTDTTMLSEHNSEDSVNTSPTKLSKKMTTLSIDSDNNSKQSKTNRMQLVK